MNEENWSEGEQRIGNEAKLIKTDYASAQKRHFFFEDLISKSIFTGSHVLQP